MCNRCQGALNITWVWERDLLLRPGLKKQHEVFLAMPALSVHALSWCVPWLLCCLTDERAVGLRHCLAYRGKAALC